QLNRLQKLQEEDSETRSRKQLLGYKVEEFRELDLGATELDELEIEHKRLANAESMLMDGQQAVVAIAGDEQSETHASQLVYRAIQHLGSLDDPHPALNESRSLLDQAHILLEEAGSSLQNYLEQVDINPHRLHQVEQRMGDIFSLARKHQAQPSRLYDYWQEIEAELAELSLSDEGLDALKAEVETLETDFRAQAKELSHKRTAAAQQLDEQVCSNFESMALGKARFFTQIEPLADDAANAHGIDNIQFLVQTNPGMPAGPLSKVASGGELSRISLAIQVVTAATSDISSLIFDEVDVGIGGGTAERVGRLMRQLGNRGQVMCVTHQPQVASQAHHHLQVHKISGDEQTHTKIRRLDNTQRAEEIARMLGGVELTQQTLDHASEMLKLAQSS
ncbi:MAG: DNA repair protein RecN, partial [Oceanobacter sp.]